MDVGGLVGWLKSGERLSQRTRSSLPGLRIPKQEDSHKVAPCSEDSSAMKRAPPAVQWGVTTTSPWRQLYPLTLDYSSFFLLI